jgi:hypothetical protein
MNTVLTMCNRNGFPCIESTGVTVTADEVLFSFNPHSYVNNNFQGAFFVKISQTYTAPGTPLPIKFTTTGVSNSTVNLTGLGDANITSETFNATGIYICFYDRADNTLQLLTIPA